MYGLQVEMPSPNIWAATARSGRFCVRPHQGKHDAPDIADKNRGAAEARRRALPAFAGPAAGRGKIESSRKKPVYLTA